MSIKKPYKSLAHTIRDVVESTSLEEHRRAGSVTNPIVRDKQRVGAKRAKATKSIKVTKIRKPRTKKSFVYEAAVSDKRPEKAVTVFNPSLGRYTVLARNQRRRLIRLTGGNSTVDSQYFQPYQNPVTGEIY